MQQISNRKREARYSNQKYRSKTGCPWPQLIELPLTLIGWLAWPISELRERHTNNSLCARCWEILRRTGKAKRRAQKASFRIASCEGVFASSDHIDSLGNDCGLCLLFKTTILEEMMVLARLDENESSLQTIKHFENCKSFHVIYRMAFDEFDSRVSHSLEFQYYFHDNPVNPRISKTLHHASSKGNWSRSCSLQLGTLQVNIWIRIMFPRPGTSFTFRELDKLNINVCPCQ
jgi:hypothetical protein